MQIDNILLDGSQQRCENLLHKVRNGGCQIGAHCRWNGELVL